MIERSDRNQIRQHMNRAPIVVIAYNRLHHLKKTIYSLQNNTLANESDMFVFIDGPKPGDEEAVLAVVEFAQSISGFKSVTIKQREENIYPDNIFQSIQEMLDSNEYIIFTEDDNECAPGFLQFMNEGLRIYKDDEKILSISGFKRPLETIPKEDFYAFNRFSPWGFAIWADKFDFSMLDFSMSDYKAHKVKFKEFSLIGKNVIQGTLKGWLNGWDVKITMNMMVDNKYSIYPKKSLVRNFGSDGSGVNSRFKSSKFDIKELWDKSTSFKLHRDYEFNNQIWAEVKRKDQKLTFREVIINLTMHLNIYPYLIRIYRSLN